MGLKLSIWENAARIRAELRIGAAVVLVRGQTGVLAGAAVNVAAAHGGTDRAPPFRAVHRRAQTSARPTSGAPTG